VIRKHVVFGRVVDGKQIVDVIENEFTDKKDKPMSPVIIANCGELVPVIHKGLPLSLSLLFFFVSPSLPLSWFLPFDAPNHPSIVNPQFKSSKRKESMTLIPTLLLTATATVTVTAIHRLHLLRLLRLLLRVMITHAKGSTRRRRRKSHPKESIRNTDPRKRDHAKTETVKVKVKVKVKMRTEGLPSARSTDPVTTKRLQNPPPLLLRLLRLLLLQLEKRRNLQGVLIPLENRAG